MEGFSKRPLTPPSPRMRRMRGEGVKLIACLCEFQAMAVRSLSPFFTGRGWGEGLSPYDSNFGNATLASREARKSASAELSGGQRQNCDILATGRRDNCPEGAIALEAPNSFS
jgi:hypothetical protein